MAVLWQLFSFNSISNLEHYFIFLSQKYTKVNMGSKSTLLQIMGESLTIKKLLEEKSLVVIFNNDIQKSQQ